MKIRQEVINELGDLIAHLEKQKINYIISGSIALNSYLVPRFTRDVDIVINLKRGDVEVFFQHFRQKFYLNEKEAVNQIDNYGFFNALSFSTGYKYDFIVQKNNAFEKIKFERKKRMQIFEITAWVISIEDLILSKVNWMQQTKSDIQKNDVLGLLEENEVDMAYIKDWVTELKLNTFGLL